MLSLILAAVFFAGIHLGIAGTAMRDRAIGILGKNGYMAAFAVASVIGLGWLVVAYAIQRLLPLPPAPSRDLLNDPG